MKRSGVGNDTIKQVFAHKSKKKSKNMGIQNNWTYLTGTKYANKQVMFKKKSGISKNMKYCTTKQITK